jgi:hypothetical protein
MPILLRMLCRATSRDPPRTSQLAAHNGGKTRASRLQVGLPTHHSTRRMLRSPHPPLTNTTYSDCRTACPPVGAGSLLGLPPLGTSMWALRGFHLPPVQQSLGKLFLHLPCPPATKCSTPQPGWTCPPPLLTRRPGVPAPATFQRLQLLANRPRHRRRVHRERVKPAAIQAWRQPIETNKMGAAPRRPPHLPARGA